MDGTDVTRSPWTMAKVPVARSVAMTAKNLRFI
jgi:hypothetical protein